MSDGAVSHDKVTRFLSGEDFDSKKLCLEIKPLIRQYESTDACLVFDDTIIGKPYMDENELICRHWDHSKGRNIKWINILPAFYVFPLSDSDESLRIPLAYEAVKKTVVFSKMYTIFAPSFYSTSIHYVLYPSSANHPMMSDMVHDK